MPRRRRWEEMPRDLYKIPPKRAAIYLALAVVGILIVYTFFTGYYTVQADEVGVIRRFGAFVRITEPGLHFKLPLGVETVTMVKAQPKVHKLEFGFRTIESARRTRYSEGRYPEESLMLTGDLNIADVEWIVQYRIRDPRDWLFKVRDVEDTITDVAEATMRLIVGDSSVTEVLTERRQEIAAEAAKRMQDVLNLYQTGVEVVTVKLQDVNPPESVKASFNEVNQARQEKETTINQARATYNKAIPAARGEARRIVQEAEGYAAKRVNEARGDVALFEALRVEYEKAKAVTRARLYLEAMAELLPKVQKVYVVDEEAGGLLKVLDLEGVRSPRGGVR